MISERTEIEELLVECKSLGATDEHLDRIRRVSIASAHPNQYWIRWFILALQEGLCPDRWLTFQENKNK